MPKAKVIIFNFFFSIQALGYTACCGVGGEPDWHNLHDIVSVAIRAALQVRRSFQTQIRYMRKKSAIIFASSSLVIGAQVYVPQYCQENAEIFYQTWMSQN